MGAAAAAAAAAGENDVKGWAFFPMHSQRNGEARGKRRWEEKIFDSK